MSAPDPEPSSDTVAAERRRRQRARNLAVLFVLTGIVVLVYAITIVKIELGYRP